MPLEQVGGHEAPVHRLDRGHRKRSHQRQSEQVAPLGREHVQLQGSGLPLPSSATAPIQRIEAGEDSSPEVVAQFPLCSYPIRDAGIGSCSRERRRPARKGPPVGCQDLGKRLVEAVAVPLPDAVRATAGRMLLNVAAAAIAGSRHNVVDGILSLAAAHGGAAIAPVVGREGASTSTFPRSRPALRRGRSVSTTCTRLPGCIRAPHPSGHWSP